MKNARAYCGVCAGLLGLALLLPNPAAAAWPTDPLVNVPLCTAIGNQSNGAIAPDGAGGAIITWHDSRSGSSDIYAQRVAADGTPQWAADGVAVCSAANEQYNPTIAADGTGGVIVTWEDLRGGFKTDIYAQRISAGGVAQWTANGVALCTAGGHQQSPTIIPDGVGGAIVTWMGLFGGNYDVYAQRISDVGAAQWTANGVALCTAAGHQYHPVLVTDGAGGAIVTWRDQRTGGDYTFSDTYAQRISAGGVVQWTPNGVAVCTATGPQQEPAIASDGAGGAIVIWFDYRSGNYDIYAQRISVGGAVQWTADGVAICTRAGEQAMPTIIADGAGGAIATWRDNRSGNGFDVYAQRMSAGGSPLWTADGIALCTATDYQVDPAITADGVGGAIVTWYDYRGGDYDIYAQRVSLGGAVQWAADGIAVCTAPGFQLVPTLVGDGAGGAIVTWYDRRSSPDADIYAQRIPLTNASSSVPEAVAFSLCSYPNPFNPQTTVHFALPVAGPVRLSIYDVAGRLVRTLVEAGMAAGGHEVAWDGRDASGCGVSSGSYFARLSFGGKIETMAMGLVR